MRDLYYKRVRTICDDVIKGISSTKRWPTLADEHWLTWTDFAACAKGRTVSATWLCRRQRLAMNSCMVANATPAAEDAARNEWFAGRQERRRKKEEELVKVEQRRAEVIELTMRQEAIEKEREEAASKAKEAEAGGKKSGGWWS